jgi:hypothetical protein
MKRNDLARAVEDFMKIPLPDRSADEEADQLQADLLLFDSAVGDTLMTMLNGGRVPREDLRNDLDLRQRLERLAASDNPIAVTDAQLYLGYLNGLEHLLEMARAMISHHA